MCSSVQAGSSRHIWRSTLTHPASPRARCRWPPQAAPDSLSRTCQSLWAAVVARNGSFAMPPSSPHGDMTGRCVAVFHFPRLIRRHCQAAAQHCTSCTAHLHDAHQALRPQHQPLLRLLPAQLGRGGVALAKRLRQQAARGPVDAALPKLVHSERAVVLRAAGGSNNCLSHSSRHRRLVVTQQLPAWAHRVPFLQATATQSTEAAGPAAKFCLQLRTC